LIATAVMNEGSFANVLDRRLKRIAEMEQANGNQMKVISPPTNGAADARLPPRLADRRFRRM